MKYLAFAIVSALLALQPVSAEQSGMRVKASTFQPRAWLETDDPEIYRDGKTIYVLYQAWSVGEFQYSVFNPPEGDKFKVIGSLPGGSARFLLSVAESTWASIDGLTILFFPGNEMRDEDRSGLSFRTQGIDLARIPDLPQELRTSLAMTPESFRAGRPWIPASAEVIPNPDWNERDPFSSRFWIVDPPLSPMGIDPRWVGTWRFLISGAGRPQGPIDLAWLQAHTKLPDVAEREVTKEGGSWRGLRLNADGTVDADSGNVRAFRRATVFPGARWVEGWVISDEWKTNSPLFYSSDPKREYLWLVLKNGDYFRGSPPNWVVFSREKRSS